MPNSPNARARFFARIALGSVLQGFLITAFVALSVFGSFYLALDFLTGRWVRICLGRSANAPFLNVLVSGLTFAKPVVGAWVLVVLTSAAIRRYPRRRSKTAGSQDEKR